MQSLAKYQIVNVSSLTWNTIVSTLFFAAAVRLKFSNFHNTSPDCQVAEEVEGAFIPIYQSAGFVVRCTFSELYFKPPPRRAASYLRNPNIYYSQIRAVSSLVIIFEGSRLLFFSFSHFEGRVIYFSMVPDPLLFLFYRPSRI